MCRKNEKALSPEDFDSYADYIVATGMEHQKTMLEETLKSGVPITYRDEQGNLVQENPDGTITILHEKKGGGASSSV